MLLFDYGRVYSATVMKRPSAHIQSPYVADIWLSGTPTTKTYLAHCPALGCCGLSDVGAVVLVRQLNGKQTKCDYQVCVSCVGTVHRPIHVGVHPKSAEEIAKCALLSGKVRGLRVKWLQAEKTLLNSRFDFHGLSEDNRPFVCEVKMVPLADYADVSTKERNRMDFSHLDTHDKIAYFPDGYRKHKSSPVSPRATKHVQELTKLTQKHKSWRCILLFVIQREDASCFQPSVLDPVFRREVQKAHRKGVEVECLQVRWNAGRAYFHRNDLPVFIHDEVQR